MGSPLLSRFFRRRLLFAAPIGLSLSFLHYPSGHAIRCDYGPPIDGPGEADWTNKPRPVAKVRSRGMISKSTVRQISLGSVLGLLVGMGMRAFSRTLVLMVGLGIIAIEWAAYRGYNIIPVNRLQKYVKQVDLRRSLTENLPFKASLGTTMLLAALAEF